MTPLPALALEDPWVSMVLDSTVGFVRVKESSKAEILDSRKATSSLHSRGSQNQLNVQNQQGLNVQP